MRNGPKTKLTFKNMKKDEPVKKRKNYMRSWRRKRRENVSANTEETSRLSKLEIR